jgi:endonuclease-3
MKRAEKAERILAMLDELYPDVRVPLDHVDPYTLLVAVLLSAQCTDKKVNEITPRLFARAATPAAMVKLSVDEIRAIIKPCGLSPAKAKAIHALSVILLDEHDGQVPPDFDELEALPGVGHKTASVVMAQAFGVPAFPVDTHIHRLAARWGLSDGSSVERTERDLKRLFPRETWNRLHLQIIYFGREHCPARGHDLAACPLCSFAATKARMRAEAQNGGARKTARKTARRSS